MSQFVSSAVEASVHEVEIDFSASGSARMEERISGGADDDDLSLAGSVADFSQRREERSKLMKALNRFKILCLFAIWLTLLIIFTIKEEESPIPRPLNILPNKTRHFDLELRNKDLSRLEVQVYGPFTNSRGDYMQKNLSIQVVLHNADEGKSISSKWHLQIGDDLNEMVYKEKLFELEKQTTVIDTVCIELVSSLDVDLLMRIAFLEAPIDTKIGIIVGSLILLFLYAMIVWEIIDRTFASMIAAMLGLATCAAMNERPSISTIMTWIDTETIVLLFGMMILVAVLAESGIFDYLAVLAFKIAKGRIWPLLNVMSVATATLSAVLDNVTMMLLVTPVIIRLCEVTSMNPVPILMSMVIFSNVGAAATPVGDPPNLIITTNRQVRNAGVNFGNFCAHMTPGVILVFITTYIFIRIKYRDIRTLQLKDAKADGEQREAQAWQRAADKVGGLVHGESKVRDAMQQKANKLKKQQEGAGSTQQKQAEFEETLERLREEYPIRNKPLLIKATIAFIFVLSLFFLHSVPHLHHLTLGWTALLGALLLLVMADIEDFEALMGQVEWNTLIFFASLFILMESLTRLGLISVLGQFVGNIVLSCPVQWRLAVALLIIIWVSGLASAILNNIPVTTMMLRIIIQMGENEELNIPLQPLVWALAFGACFGGNGTLIGASANVVSAGIIQQHGYKFGFVEFFLVGFPIMIFSLIAVTCYLMVCHVAFAWH